MKLWESAVTLSDQRRKGLLPINCEQRWERGGRRAEREEERGGGK